MSNKDKDMLSVTEVAKIMGISRTHVLRKIKEGVIPALKVGRSFIIKRSDLPGIYRKITSQDKKEVEKAVDRMFKDYANVIRKLGKT
ncbi:MAG: helix-turn-helix domain-containing protein [Pseudomonadota bacterium]